MNKKELHDALVMARILSCSVQYEEYMSNSSLNLGVVPTSGASFFLVRPCLSQQPFLLQTTTMFPLSKDGYPSARPLLKTR